MKKISLILILVIQISFVISITETELFERQTDPICPENGMFISGICFGCMQNCTECTNPGTCGKCDNEWFVMREDHCQVAENHLQEQHFIDYKTNPLIKEAQGCDEGCRTQGDFICLSCLPGYKQAKGYCVACNVEFCADCTNSLDLCMTCMDGYIFESSECKPCDSQNCKRCTDTSATGCDECYQGYKNESGACLPCVQGCANCQDQVTCDICMDGYFKDGNICTECGQSVRACIDADNPIQCIDGFAIINSKCISVSQVYSYLDASSCQIFEDHDSCIKCFEGYSLVNGKCFHSACSESEYQTANGAPCQSCGSAVAKCTYDNGSIIIDECKDDAFLENNTCVACAGHTTFTLNADQIAKCNANEIIECYGGFTVSNSKTECVQCPANCNQCSIDSQDNVTGCDLCDISFRQDPKDNMICSTCNKDNYCAACAENFVDCTECLPGYYLTEFHNCSNQIPNCYQVDNEGCYVCRVGFRRSADKQSCIDCTQDNSCQTVCVPETLLENKTKQKNDSQLNQLFSIILFVVVLHIAYMI